MHRLFVACRPPLAVRTALISLMGGVEGARWQRDDQLHITLRFIGDVPSNVANDIAETLPAMHGPALQVSLEGVGSFDRRGKVHTLWAGVRPRDGLETLHKKIDRVLVALGLPSEARAYLPHITLARLNAPQERVAGFLAAHAGLASLPFRIDEFSLFESLGTSDGRVYRPVLTCPLGGSAFD